MNQWPEDLLKMINGMKGQDSLKPPQSQDDLLDAARYLFNYNYGYMKASFYRSINPLTGAQNSQLVQKVSDAPVGSYRWLAGNDKVGHVPPPNFSNESNMKTEPKTTLDMLLDLLKTHVAKISPECVRYDCEYEIGVVPENLSYSVKHNGIEMLLEEYPMSISTNKDYVTEFMKRFDGALVNLHPIIAIFDGGPLDGQEKELEQYSERYIVPVIGPIDTLETSVTYYKLNDSPPYVYSVTRP